jgi:hypothetical protein
MLVLEGGGYEALVTLPVTYDVSLPAFLSYLLVPDPSSRKLPPAY